MISRPLELSTLMGMCLCASTHAADPGQMRPLLIQTNWEIAARHRITDKGWRIETRDRDHTEWVRITGGVLHVMGKGQSKPSETYAIKIVRLADESVGLLELSKGNNGLPDSRLLYRFKGNRLFFCFGKSLKDTPKSFAAAGSRVLELIPYQQDRIVKSCRRPQTKPEAVFLTVAPPQPPPPPQPKNRDE